MINFREYRILSIISRKKKRIDTKKYMTVLRSLLDSGMIILVNPYFLDPFSIVYRGCAITEKGRRAMEQYRTMIIKITVSVLGALAAIASAVVPFVI